ncbi:hypothetical protein LWC35_05900 [Pseudonocardia kujensis]|uniref:hypothetical protein n=1 Tax=Pseudonocardia kujensis TaxID=1128675 RepID=UPI001E345B24|nr:hypothetical protein [Pseudonocardia kujensis]MCE0762443.1 hypothetical protein [Pseudonocardia kujensis]
MTGRLAPGVDGGELGRRGQGERAHAAALGSPGPPRASTTRRCADYVLRRLAIDKTTVAAVARELGR